VKTRISAYYLLLFLAIGSGPPFLTLLLRQRGLSAIQIGLLLAVGAIAGTIFQPLIGHLSDLMQRPRRLLFLSALFSPLLYAGYMILPNSWPLFFVAILLAMVQGATPLADALALREGEQFGFSYGEVRLWGALGYALIVAIAGLIYHRFGLSLSIWMYALFTLPLLYVITLLPERKDAAGIHADRPGGLWMLWRHHKLISFFVIMFFVKASLTIISSDLLLYYQALHYPMQWVGLNFTVAALVEIPVFYLSGRIIKRFGLMRTVIFGASSYAIKYALMALAPGVFLEILLQSLDGVAYALYWSAAVDMVNQLAPMNRKSSAQTLFGAVAGSLSGIVGAGGGGWLLEKFGAVHLFGIIAFTTLMAIGLYIVLAVYLKRQVRLDISE